MRNHSYQNYFDDEVLAASPLKLIQMLYGAALDSIAAARRHVQQKNIAARTRSINKAIGLVTELSGCLNHEADIVLCRNLAGLYGYVVRLLIEANVKQTESPLAEAEALLLPLAEAWKACAPPLADRNFPEGELLLQETSMGGPTELSLR
jgi:flagellar secretion chaperone FliS